VAPRSRLTKDIEALAPLLAGAPLMGQRRSGFFSKLLSKKADNGTPGTS
jgi:hypothetical protein